MYSTYKRLGDTLKNNRIIQFIRKYSYIETLLLITIFLISGYFFSPDDICLTQKDVPYLLILLSIVTLFHGFESGMLALGVIALVMWFFYESFPYVHFLVNLLMVMIFSEFHYFWTKQIKELKTSNEYTTTKLNELANAFYSLKISHDQLEKNYVLKPMSIRSAIEEILHHDTQKRSNETFYFNDFLALLEKSFHLQGGFIIYAKNNTQEEYLSAENSEICYSATSETYEKEEIFNEYLIDKAINYKQAVYVSDDEGNPTIKKELQESKFLAAIPVIYNKKILALLVIEKMPFMAFNRENLISLAILFEYLLITALKEKLLHESKELLFIKEREFRYEYIRTALLHKKYNINSTLMVFKIKNEIQSIKIFEKAQHMLRSLDILTQYKSDKGLYFILFLFPLNDKAAAIGFLNRLLSTLEDERDTKFEHMLFRINEEALLKKYIEDKYHD
ncbi:MAG: PelD GGDEF domain-containing protein [Sulfurimonas sp.]